jgi:hypothetical protein
MKHALELLEAKTGHVKTTYDFQLASEKAIATPGDLTDEEILTIDFFAGKAQGEYARSARERAKNPPADPPAAAATTTAHGVEFPDHLWNDDAPDPADELKRWSLANAVKATPIALWWMGLSTARTKREMLEAKVAALEEKVAALESRPAPEVLPYKGVWKSETAYIAGQFVTYDGSLWHANGLTYSRPGTDGTFTLAVKHGKDRR